MVIKGCLGDATESECRLEGQVKGGAPCPQLCSLPEFCINLDVCLDVGRPFGYW